MEPTTRWVPEEEDDPLAQFLAVLRERGRNPVITGNSVLIGRYRADIDAIRANVVKELKLYLSLLYEDMTDHGFAGPPIIEFDSGGRHISDKSG